MYPKLNLRRKFRKIVSSDNDQLSPDKDKELEKERNRKEGLGTFYTFPHYVKLYDTLKGAYSNYKVCQFDNYSNIYILGGKKPDNEKDIELLIVCFPIFTVDEPQ